MFDTLKRDAEINFLLGCIAEDIQTPKFFDQETRTLYVPDPMVVIT